MASTRFRNDPARIEKELEQSTFSGRYLLDTPGPGISLPYMMDPQIRMQKWGANLATDTTNLESELFCLGRTLTHDCSKTYVQNNVFTGRLQSFPVNNDYVLESRASDPAWLYRDLEQTRWETPFINPVETAVKQIDKPFADNISSRIISKDTFTPIIPFVNNDIN
jgi:hypothetical protein